MRNENQCGNVIAKIIRSVESTPRRSSTWPLWLLCVVISFFLLYSSWPKINAYIMWLCSAGNPHEMQPATDPTRAATQNAKMSKNEKRNSSMCEYEYKTDSMIRLIGHHDQNVSFVQNGVHCTPWKWMHECMQFTSVTCKHIVIHFHNHVVCT